MDHAGEHGGTPADRAPLDEEQGGSSLAQALAELARLRAAGEQRIRLAGCEGPLAALVAAQLALGEPAARRPLVVVARDGAHAAALARDLSFFLPQPAASGD